MVEMYLLCRSSSPGIVMRCKDFGCWWWVHAEAPKYKQGIGEGNAPQSQQIRQSRSKRPFDNLVVGVKLFCCCCCFRFLTCQHFEWLTTKIRNNCLTFCFFVWIKNLDDCLSHHGAIHHPTPGLTHSVQIDHSLFSLRVFSHRAIGLGRNCLFTNSQSCLNMNYNMKVCCWCQGSPPPP